MAKSPQLKSRISAIAKELANGKERGYIYRITSPLDKIYIGSTNNIKKRFKNYRCLNCKQQIKLHASFVKYGVANHKFEILEECSSEAILEREAFYGQLYNSLSRTMGLNLRLPKSGDTKNITSDETRQKQSVAMIGKFKGEKNYFFNKTHSDESRKIMSEKRRGIASNCKKVICIETQQIYNTLKDAAYHKGIKCSLLSAYLRGKCKNKSTIRYAT